MTEVDLCKSAKDIWERIKRLMLGFDVTSHVRHSRLIDKFDKFAAKEGESLEFVHEILTTMVKIMDRNNICPIPLSINTKFLNCLQPDWSKYVTMVRHNQTGDVVTYDELEQILLAMKDEAKRNLKDKENDFRLDNSYRDTTLEELTTAVIMMVQIQPTNDNLYSESSYDAKTVSEVNASNKVHEQVNHAKRKPIIHTPDDDQIDSNIIFDDPYVKNNSGTSEHDSNAHDEYHDI
nr:hypothetical protein [Tanacetum cinerariifolium]